MGKRKPENQFCYDLIKTFTEADNQEILEMVQEKYPEYTIKQVSNVRQGIKRATERNGEKESVQGDTEYVPKHSLTDKGYKINYAKTYFEATHEDIRQALMKYCIGRLTMNQVSLSMKWTRAEFNALKTAFKITKDTPPFTPYEIDQLSSDEMAEIMRIEKKRYALEKFEANKHKDIEKEIERYNKSDFWLQRVAELVNKSEKPDFPVCIYEQDQEEEVHLIKITDEHAGLLVDSIYNTYNLKVMDYRFEQLCNWIINNIPKGRVIITSNGDLIHGTIHGSTDKHSTYMIDSFHAVTDCYIKLFKTLVKAGYKITFAKANGSHSSIEKAKQDRTEEDNLGRTLPFILERVFEDWDEVEILLPLKATNLTVIPIFKYGIMIGHGDEMKMNAFAKNARIVSELVGYPVKEVHLGHIHHYKCEDIELIKVEYTECFCGPDQYATRLGLHAPYGFNYIKYNPNQRELIKFINLRDA